MTQELERNASDGKKIKDTEHEDSDDDSDDDDDDDDSDDDDDDDDDGYLKKKIRETMDYVYDDDKVSLPETRLKAAPWDATVVTGGR